MKEHESALLKFIDKQLPSDWPRPFSQPGEGSINNDFRIGNRVLAFSLVAHGIRLGLRLHDLLLDYSWYAKLSARLLWIRLEQKQSQNQDDEEETENDERYEHWFSNNYQPPEIIATENHQQFFNRIDSVLDTWFEGKSRENDFMLYGERGIGKTSLVKKWTETSEREHVRYIDIPARTLTEEKLFKLLSSHLNIPINSLEDIVEADKNIEKTIVVLDNCENLFLSTIDGFTSYECMLEIIDLSLSNIFWVFVCSKEPYIYLNDVFGRLTQYSHRFDMSSWKPEEIRSLILSRHRISRRKLVFDELLFSSIGNDEVASYAASEDRCFLLLAEKSSGNPALAMSIWARAAAKKERLTVEIGLPEKPSAGILDNYNSDLLFIYATLIKHQSLTAQEAALATRQNISVSRRAFKLGLDNGFLKMMDEERCIIHPYWYSVLLNFLQAKNYLHGN